MNEVKGWNYSEVFEALVAGTLPAGTNLGGRYEIGEMLGKGGVGLVYRATDLMLGEEVVLKILNPALASDPDTVKRFKREIKICRRISHPNVIRIYDIDEIYGTLFISMELVSGTNLKNVVRRRGRLPEAEGWELVRGMVQGLAAAHALGIVHRDLKSQNVMVDAEGRLKILDFGMARLLGMDHLTRGGDILGSPPYMSPEQAQGQELDHRTDIYSLGIILFEMFTGQLPFLGETPLATVLLQIDREPPRPSSVHPGISPDLERAILTCLRKKPAERFQHVDELLAARAPARGARAQTRCARCGEPSAAGARACRSCGLVLAEAARPPTPRWHVLASEPEPPASAFGACLAGAAAACTRERPPLALRWMLELAATLQAGGAVAEFRRAVGADAHAAELTAAAPLLALVAGLRHFTNRARMRETTRELLTGLGRETVVTGCLVGETLSLLARQRSREASGALTLRSLRELLRERLRKAFSAEGWLLVSLGLLDEPLEQAPDRLTFESLYSSQPALVALHVLFGASAPGGFEDLLGRAGTAHTPEDEWRTIAAALIGALWAFWHGAAALPFVLLRRQDAAALAYDLGRELYPAG
jgi:predicted Ser/Thr protein kinase